jgi:cytochrome c-type biogenesis protein CcmH/NrfG
MVGNKRDSSEQGQIPYSLYATAHEPAAQRRRWVVETILGILIVAGLAVLGYLVYQKQAAPSNPAQQTQTQTQAQAPSAPSQKQTVSQPPQQNGGRLKPPQPKNGQQSSSLNRKAVQPPKN